MITNEMAFNVFVIRLSKKLITFEMASYSCCFIQQQSLPKTMDIWCSMTVCKYSVVEEGLLEVSIEVVK